MENHRSLPAMVQVLIEYGYAGGNTKTSISLWTKVPLSDDEPSGVPMHKMVVSNTSGEWSNGTNETQGQGTASLLEYLVKVHTKLPIESRRANKNGKNYN